MAAITTRSGAGPRVSARAARQRGRTALARGRVALAVVALVGAVGCGGDDQPDADEVAVDVLEGSDAWVRMPATEQSVAAAYLTFANRGDTDVRVADVSSPLATAELHETVTDDDGVMRMEHRSEGFVVQAGGELVFEPGGAHVMLLDVDPTDLRLLDDTELTFQVGGDQIEGGELVVVAEIRDDHGDP